MRLAVVNRGKRRERGGDKFHGREGISPFP